MSPKKASQHIWFQIGVLQVEIRFFAENAFLECDTDQSHCRFLQRCGSHFEQLTNLLAQYRIDCPGTKELTSALDGYDASLQAFGEAIQDKWPQRTQLDPKPA